MTTLEEMEPIARRVFGGAHPHTEGIANSLRAARDRDGLASSVFITMGQVPCRVSGHNDENSTPPSLLALSESHTGDSTTSGEDAQSPRQDRARLRWREIKFPGRAAAAAHDDSTNASPRVETNAIPRWRGS